MKKRGIIIVSAAAAVVLAVSMLLAACGSSSSSGQAAPASAETKESGYGSAADYAVNTESNEYLTEAAYAEEADAAERTEVSQKAYNGEVKLIYRADVYAEAKDIDKAAADLEKLAADMGGYVEYSDIGNYGYGNDYSRYANYTIRIPSEKYEAFLEAFGGSGSCTVRSISKSTEDVGADYADTEARLKTLRIKQERLQELLARAENMEDIITIENALTDLEYQLEWNTSTLNRYDALVGFSTITINLQQVARETQTSEGVTLTERIVNAFHNGIAAFATGFENFVVVLAGAVIPLLIVIAVIIIVILLIRRTLKKKKQHDPGEDA